MHNEGQPGVPSKCCCPSSNLHGPACPCYRLIYHLGELDIVPSAMNSSMLPCRCPSAKLHGPSCSFQAEVTRKSCDTEWRRLSSLGEEIVLETKLFHERISRSKMEPCQHG